MVEALASLGEEARHTRIGTGGLQQLDLAVAGGEQDRAHALVHDLRFANERQPERIAPESAGMRERLDDDAHVMDLPHHTFHTVARSTGGIQADSSPWKSRW